MWIKLSRKWVGVIQIVGKGLRGRERSFRRRGRYVQRPEPVRVREGKSWDVPPAPMII